MPIPRNWSEEVICEWLQLLEYMTEVGVPVGVGTGGGRKEADVGSSGWLLDAETA